MTVRDSELARFPGWPKGVNNVAREDSLAPEELREAVNVDLTNEGKPQRRDGYSRVVTGSFHSAFGDWEPALLAVKAGALTAYDDALTATTVRSDLTSHDVSYAPAPDGCYYSNGRVIGRINPDTFADEPVWVDCPGQPVVDVHASSGGMAAGEYQVAVTYLDSFGRESGSSLAAVVNVPEGQGIRVSGFHANADATTIRIYLSPCDGDVLYAAADVPIGASQWLLGAGTPRKKALETQFLYPLPPGQIIRHHAGRNYVADKNVLRWSPAFRFGLTGGDLYWKFGQVIDLMEPVGQADGSGVFVGCGKRTYFLAGPDPKNWRQLVARHSGVVPGTGRVVPGNWFGLEGAAEAAFWLSTDGVFCLGLPTGQVVPLTEGRAVTAESAESGAVLLRQSSGLRQIVASLLGGTTNTMAASDAAVATVRTHDVTTD